MICSRLADCLVAFPVYRSSCHPSINPIPRQRFRAGGRIPGWQAGYNHSPPGGRAGRLMPLAPFGLHHGQSFSALLQLSLPQEPTPSLRGTAVGMAGLGRPPIHQPTPDPPTTFHHLLGNPIPPRQNDHRPPLGGRASRPSLPQATAVGMAGLGRPRSAKAPSQPPGKPHTCRIRLASMKIFRLDE